ncbi:hypothetical protein [Rubrivivax sp. A210]|uniref:hypothetical protein n=1 Tax=Rubrivivax sp. A210 TaxID=2772301 RepID=UPI001919C052|nr:hypothetical protein [Rubrivivax sp. A210]
MDVEPKDKRGSNDFAHGPRRIRRRRKIAPSDPKVLASVQIPWFAACWFYFVPTDARKAIARRS